MNQVNTKTLSRVYADSGPIFQRSAKRSPLAFGPGGTWDLIDGRISFDAANRAAIDANRAAIDANREPLPDDGE